MMKRKEKMMNGRMNGERMKERKIRRKKGEGEGVKGVGVGRG